DVAVIRSPFDKIACMPAGKRGERTPSRRSSTSSAPGICLFAGSPSLIAQRSSISTSAPVRRLPEAVSAENRGEPGVSAPTVCVESRPRRAQETIRNAARKDGPVITFLSSYVPWKRLDALLLQDRQVIVRHLQDDARHGRPVVGADGIEPAAVGAAAAEQFVADRRIPLGPVTAARCPHYLHGVVVAVEVVHGVVDEHLSVGLEGHEILEPGVDLRALVDAGAVEGGNAGGRARE